MGGGGSITHREHSIDRHNPKNGGTMGVGNNSIYMQPCVRIPRALHLQKVPR